MPIGTYTPPPPLANHYTKFFSIFFLFFFHFRCILLQIRYKKCFFISISILGRSGVKGPYMLLNDNNNLIKKVTFFYDSKNTNMAGPPSSQSELSYEHTYYNINSSF